MATDKYHEKRNIAQEASTLVDALIKNRTIQKAIDMFEKSTDPVLHEILHSDSALETEIAKQLLLRKQEGGQADRERQAKKADSLLKKFKETLEDFPRGVESLTILYKRATMPGWGDIVFDDDINKIYYAEIDKIAERQQALHNIDKYYADMFIERNGGMENINNIVKGVLESPRFNSRSSVIDEVFFRQKEYNASQSKPPVPDRSTKPKFTERVEARRAELANQEISK